MIFKKIIEFTVEDDIDDLIIESARKAGFYECSSALTEGIVDYNNVTYCYLKNHKKSRTFLTIHILDNRARIEAWNTEVVENNKNFQQSVNELLVLMGQKPII